MRNKHLLLILTALCIVCPFFNCVNAQLQTDSLMIKETAFNYIEGWYKGDSERMAKALHPDMVKRIIRTIDSATNCQILSSTTADAMIRNTSIGTGRGQKGSKGLIAYSLLDQIETLAMVKLITEDFIDYLQLGKLNGKWKIINVLWFNNKAKRE